MRGPGSSCPLARSPSYSSNARAPTGNCEASLAREWALSPLHRRPSRAPQSPRLPPPTVGLVHPERNDDGEEKIYTLSEMKQFNKEKCNMAVSTENVDSDFETDDEKASESNEEVEGEDNLTSQKM